jgi:uncharacterized membrane protein required for colicin V production
MTFQELVAKVGLDAREYKAGMKDIRDDGASTQQGMNKVALGIGGALVVGAGFAIKAASDLGEQVNKNNVVFGKNAKEVDAWAGTLTDKFGLSKRAALEASGTYGNMLKPMGLIPGQVKQISTDFVGLAGDLASFNNADPTVTLDALRAGLTGETEPLRRFGVFLNEARIQAEAMRMGLVKTKVDTEAVGAAQDRAGMATAKYNQALKEHGANSMQAAQAKLAVQSAEKSLEKAMGGTKVQLDASTKALAIHSIVMRDTKDAQGDFARTASSLPNTMRTLKADVENLAAGFGEMLLPSAVKAAGGLKSVLGFMQEHQGVVKLVVGAVGGLTAAYLIYTATAKVSAAVTTVITAAQLAYRVATGAATAQQLALNAAMRANVIGIVVTAIAALAVGVIYAYKHFETFRNVVDAVFGFVRKIVGSTVGFLKDHWQDALVFVLTGPFGLAVKKIADHFGGIKVLALKTVAAVVEPFSHLPGKLGGWARDAKDAMEEQLAKLDAAKAQDDPLLRAVQIARQRGAQAGSAYASGFHQAESVGMVNNMSEHAAIRAQMAAQDNAAAAKGAVDTAKTTAETTKKATQQYVIPAFTDTGVSAAKAVADGIKKKEAEAANAAADLARKAADRAAAVLDAQKARLGKKFDFFSSFVTRAFGAVQAADLGPATRDLKAFTDAIDARSIQERVDDSKKAYDEAGKAYTDLKRNEGETDAEFKGRQDKALADRLSAERAYRDAQESMTLASKQREAEAEQKDQENRQYMEQLHFQTRLTNLQSYLDSGHASAKDAKKKIAKLLSDFGIEMGGIGDELGTAFAQGLYDSIPAVVKAAVAVREAAEKAKDTRTALKVAEKRAATANRKSQDMGAGDVMKGSEATVGPSAPSGNLVEIGRWLQGLGFQVGENPAFGGVAPVHARGSYHYQGRAIDVNWPGGGSVELAKLQWAYGQLTGRSHAELLLEDAGKQNQHLHFAMAKGGIFTKPTRAVFDVAERGVAEAFIPLDDPRASAMLGGGASTTIMITGNTMLTSERETARQLYNLIEPFVAEGKIQVKVG